MFDIFNHFKGQTLETPEDYQVETDDPQLDQLSENATSLYPDDKNDQQMAELAKYYNLTVPKHQSTILDEEKFNPKSEGLDLSSVPYQQRADYQAEQLVSGEQGGIPDLRRADGSSLQKASYKNSTVSKLMNQLGSVLPQAAADEMPVSAPVPASVPQVDPMAARQAQLDAAQADRRKNLQNSVVRGASTDILNAGLQMMGVDQKLTPGYGDERLNKMTDLELQNLEGQMKLAGQVGTEEKAKIDLNDLKSMSDPSSPGSVALRDAASKFLGANKNPKMAAALAGMSGQQIQNLLGDDLAGILAKQDAREQQDKQFNLRLTELRDARADRNTLAKDRAEDKAEDKKQKIDEKTKTADKKKEESMFEVEDRRNTILNNINKLDNIISKRGTWELLGSHNQEIDAMVDEIATDMAKLTDPKSVARPSEVELWRNSLIESGFRNRNSTARDVLNKFKDRVEDRTKFAYEVRGLNTPEPLVKPITEFSKSNKKIESKQYSPSRNQTKIVYSDGTTEVINGK